MSLKAFHLFFIFLSIVLCAGVGVWALSNEMTGFFPYACLVAAAAMSAYGVYFVRKTKRLSL